MSALREPDEDSVRAQLKAEIRTRRLATRRALPAEARDARSAAIAARVRALPEWEAARAVLAFVSMAREVQTDALVEAAWRDGKTVATTRMSPARDELELFAWREGDALEESGMMFRQPLASAPRVDDAAIDLVLVPALAVDERGHRIGYGKGFYDRLLPRLDATRVALVFDFERIVEVPNRPGDEPVDVVVTDERVIRTAAR
ncbi:MAG: 5-formyltetrahydrofolate cyclo-ligase [Sandaracinaceae bacterium]|nr:5-formyltetrahydrofolate cyclo-ligase [Sandaracinaceae bacterium]